MRVAHLTENLMIAPAKSKFSLWIHRLTVGTESSPTFPTTGEHWGGGGQSGVLPSLDPTPHGRRKYSRHCLPREQTWEWVFRSKQQGVEDVVRESLRSGNDFQTEGFSQDDALAQVLCLYVRRLRVLPTSSLLHSIEKRGRRCIQFVVDSLSTIYIVHCILLITVPPTPLQKRHRGGRQYGQTGDERV